MRLGAYELARQIGAGGMGEVWIAHQVRTREPVAIKRLPRRLAGDPNYRRILLEEARLSQLLRHPNIVHTIEAGEADGEVFIAMELIDGLDLSRVTKLLAQQGERLPISVSAYVIAEVLRGLAYAQNLDTTRLSDTGIRPRGRAHGRDGSHHGLLEHHGELISLVHRDVSPHNVMLSTAGAIKLADFGVARLSSEDTSGTHVKGKARYMPPEQLRGDSRSPTVDLFAVGAVLQELLDGAVFRGDAVDDARLLGMAIDGVVPPPRHPDEIPVELERLRSRLLARDPAERPRSAQQALDLLLRWPAYEPQPEQVAGIVRRLRQREVELGSGATQTGLAHQATFLHTNELELDGSEIAELVDVVEAPDQILLALSLDSSESAARIPAVRDEHTEGTPGPGTELERTEGTDPATTGGHRAPPRDLSLALDLSGESFARHVPTSPNPIVPPRRPIWSLTLGIIVALAGGVTGAWALGWLAPGDDPTPTPATTLRHARVAGRGSLLDLGLRDRGMDRLLVDDIRFDYSPDPNSDPLESLGRGEAELALVSLDAFERAGGPGTIVAVVGVPLQSEALILDTRDHPKLRGLADLDGPLTVAHAPGRLALARRLARTLGIEVEATVLTDDAAALAELAREDSTTVAAIVRDPWIAKAREAGMTVAATGLDVPRASVEVLVVRDAVLESDPQLVEAVVAQYYASVLALHGHPGEALAGACLFDGSGAAAWLEETIVDARVEPRFALAAAAEPSSGQRPACLEHSPSRDQPSQVLGAVAAADSDAALFEPNTANLRADAAELVAKLALELRAFNAATVSAEIIGYGDRKSSGGRKLGRSRAEAIAEALRAAGLQLPLSTTGLDSREAPTSRVRIVLSRAP